MITFKQFIAEELGELYAKYQPDPPGGFDRYYAKKAKELSAVIGLPVKMWARLIPDHEDSPLTYCVEIRELGVEMSQEDYHFMLDMTRKAMRRVFGPCTETSSIIVNTPRHKAWTPVIQTRGWDYLPPDLQTMFQIAPV